MQERCRGLDEVPYDNILPNKRKYRTIVARLDIDLQLQVIQLF
jgi:hypothetical protein